MRQRLVFPLLALSLALAACGAPGPAAPTTTAQRVAPCQPSDDTSCPDPTPVPDPTPTPSPTPGSPWVLDVHPMQELVDKAAQLGVTPAEAAVPNVETLLAAQRTRPAPLLRALGGYPTGTASAQQFMDQLYASGSMQTPSTTPVTGATTTDNICTTTVQDVFSPVNWTLGGAAGSNGNDQALYAGSMLQGGSLNLGVGSLRPIYSNKFANLTLTSSLPVQQEPNIPPTLADVNAAVARMENATPSGVNIGGYKYGQVVAASSEQEAMAQLKISGQTGPWTGSLDTTYTDTTTRSTVFVYIFQASFWVDVSLPRTQFPLASLFTNPTAADLEGLGQQGQLAYDNLPLYVARVEYGRAALFSLSSNVSIQDLKQTAELAYATSSGGTSTGGTSTSGASVGGSLTTHMKNTIRNASIRVFTYGGSGTISDSALKDGTYTSFFAEPSDPRNTLPVGYQFRLVDRYGTYATRFNPLHYTQRTCNPYKAFHVNLSQVIGTARVFVTRPGGSEQLVAETGDPQSVSLTDALADGDNVVRVESSPNDNWSNQRSLRAQLYIDDDPSPKVDKQASCRRTHTRTIYQGTVNKNTGQITQTGGDSDCPFRN